MTEPLPEFDAPPVVETTMSVQFARLQPFSTAMVGWFWKQFLPAPAGGTKWEKAIDAPRLEDTFERFGDQELWQMLGIRMSSGAEANRVQISRSDNERMIQVQDSRFILNWMKQSGPYPTFAQLSTEFFDVFPTFEKFSKEAGCGPIEQNQWEIAYVNRIPKGELWHSASEWGKVIPQLSLPTAVVAKPVAEPRSVEWRYDFANERGRIHVTVQNAKVRPSEENFMHLLLVARGPVNHEKGWDLKSGFELGHEAIVRTFANMTSSEAQKLWKRSKG